MMRSFGQMSAIVLLALGLPLVGMANPEQQSASGQAAEGVGPRAEEATEMSPAESEAARLGEAFGDFDRATWELVEACWAEGEPCIERVTAYMQGQRAGLKKLLASAEAVRCESKGQGKVSIQVSKDAGGESYRKAYAAKVAPIESIRYGEADDPDREAVVREVRSMERTFRTDLCQEILDETHQNRYRPTNQPGERDQKRETAVY